MPHGYLDPLLSVLCAIEDIEDTWLGGYQIKKVLRNTSTTSDPHDNGGNKKPILYLDPLLSVLSAMEDTGDTWLGAYPVEVKFIKYLSLIPFATFQVILFQGSYLMGCLCVNIWQLYAIMTIQKSEQKQ